MNIKVVPSQFRQQTPQNEKVMDAAKMYEQQFLRDLVKAMRQTVPESELVPTSMGEKIFREQLDQQYVDSWTDKGGVGLADMIYNHIMDRYFNTRMPLPKSHGVKIEKPQGPLPAQKGEVKSTSDGIKIKMNQTQIEKPESVRSPWAGSIRQVSENGKSVGVIRHDNGLESQISYSGLGTKIEGRVEAGEKIGVKNAGTEDLLWFVKSST